MVALESAEMSRNPKPEELITTRQVTLECQCYAGREIFRESDPGDGVCLVEEGLVEISGWLNQESRRVLTQIDPGGIFGEMAVFGFGLPLPK